MERTSSFLSMGSRSSSHASANRKTDSLLPYSKTEKKPKLRMRNLLSHCLYRRAMLWAVCIVFLVCIAFMKGKDGGYDVAGYRIGANNGAQTQVTKTTTVNEAGEKVVVVVTSDADGDDKLEVHQEVQLSDEEKQKAAEEIKKMPWLRFPHLDGYFNGIKTLVNRTDHIAEYPNATHVAPLPTPAKSETIPRQQPYSPYEDDPEAKICFLDRDNQIPAPDLYAYHALPQHMPEPAIGSYELLGIRDDVCFDRFGRYGPYGLGYSKAEGGSDVGLDTESSRAEEVWAKTGKINYNSVSWGDAQDRCFARNKHRFILPDPRTEELKPAEGKKGRIAIVIRTYTGFKWTDHAVLNFRALINEMSLKSSGEYQVHFLMHVRDVNQPIWSDPYTVQRIIDENTPPEFRSMVTLWSEPQMRLMYPGEFGEPIKNPSGADVHGVYRSAHFPMQVFAMQHPQYQHFWNWEMDMRYLGSYYDFFNRLGKWAAEQPRALLWERSERYYIPPFHGSWANFTAKVEEDHMASGRRTVFGPMDFPGKAKMRYEENGQSIMPASCAEGGEMSKCGVGEDADIITLNPLFDTEESGWVFSDDATGYSAPPPRRCAIITASRLSRRLLTAMHEEVFKNHHTMFSEMFPPTVALHHGMKGVFAPHPIYIDRAWYPFSDIDAAFNGGRDHSASGKGSPFDLKNEHNHKGATWYFNSEFAGLLWRRWLGYSQLDGRGKFGGRAGEGAERGGKADEEAEESLGRICMRPLLVHPIKHEHPSEKK